MRIGLRNVLLGVCLLAPMVSGCSIGSHVPFTQVSHQQPITSEITKLVVRSSVGDVRVTGETDDQIRIEAKVTINPLRAAITEKGQFENHVKLNVDKDTLTVSDAHMDQLDQNDWGVSFIIHVPRRLSVYVDTRVGDVAVGCIDAEVAVKSSVGDLSVTGDRTTSISASTSIGDITIHGDRAAAIAASSNIGDVTIAMTGLSEKAEAETDRGDIRMSLGAAGSKVSANTNVGDINLILGASKTADGSVHAQTGTGDVRMTQGEMSSGGKVMISTGIGDVHLTTAPGSAASYKLSAGVGEVRMKKPIQVRDGQVQIKAKSLDIDAGNDAPLYELHTGRGNIMVE